MVLWLEHRTHSRGQGFESSYCRFEALTISFAPRCLSSFSCINEYMTIDSVGVNECVVVRIVIVVWLKKSNWCWNERVCQGVKYKARELSVKSGS